MRLVLQIFLFLLPWPARRFLLSRLFGYSISRDAYIGYSILLARKLSMGAASRIGHLSMITTLAEVALGDHARIGNLNWITGASPGSRLLLDDHSAITHRHLIDCTDEIRIGRFSTLAGWRSQLLTHSIDIETGRQSSASITIGDFCFVGTGTILLKGCSLPSYSVLAAGAVLASRPEDTYGLYGGVPARFLSALSPDAAYFTRATGFVQ